MRIAKLILSTLLTLFILGCIAVGVVYIQLKSDLPDVESLKTVELQQPMQIYTERPFLGAVKSLKVPAISRTRSSIFFKP